jgi:hypothetical protein
VAPGNPSRGLELLRVCCPKCPKCSLYWCTILILSHRKCRPADVGARNPTPSSYFETCSDVASSLHNFLPERYVTSDCGAIQNIYQEHKYTKDGPSAAAVSVKAGTDVDCGSVYKNSLGAAVKKSLVSVALRFIFLVVLVILRSTLSSKPSPLLHNYVTSWPRVFVSAIQITCASK